MSGRPARVPLLASLLILLFGSHPCLAVKKEVEVNTSKPKEESNGNIAFGKIPASSEHVAVLVEDAQVVINRVASGSEITVLSNCPHNWNLNGVMIRQAGFAKTRAGVAMVGDALGSRAIVNGRIYPLPSGGVKGLQLNQNGVFVGGQKVEPLAGADVPGACSGPDLIEVRVPDTYTGSLIIGAGGNSEVKIDNWHGGKVECTMLGHSNLDAAKLKSLEKAVVDMRGTGKAEIGDLSTKILVANVNGAGNVTIHGSADTSNATVSGAGTITLKGKFKGLQKSVDGGGAVNVTN